MNTFDMEAIRARRNVPLNPEELESLDEWKRFFRGKYTIVGDFKET